MSSRTLAFVESLPAVARIQCPMVKLSRCSTQSRMAHRRPYDHGDCVWIPVLFFLVFRPRAHSASLLVTHFCLSMRRRFRICIPTLTLTCSCSAVLLVAHARRSHRLTTLGFCIFSCHDRKPGLCRSFCARLQLTIGFASCLRRTGRCLCVARARAQHILA